MQSLLRHHAFATFHKLATQLLLEGEKEQEDIFATKLIGSMVFSAFTLEAYANRLGEGSLALWDRTERNTTISKIKKLYEQYQVVFDESRRPIQTAKELFRFRAQVAHGRTESHSITANIQTERVDVDFSSALRSFPLLTDVSMSKARRALEDVSEIIQTLYRCTGDDTQLMENVDGSCVSIFDSPLWGEIPLVRRED